MAKPAITKDPRVTPAETGRPRIVAKSTPESWKNSEIKAINSHFPPLI
jgi:hypothetical protein